MLYATDGSKLTGTITASTATNVTGTVAVANGGTGKTTFGATAGVLKTDGSNVLSAATIVDADVATGAAIDPKKIAGTASTLAQVRARTYQGANTLDVPSRQFVTAGAAPVNGIVRGYFFTPDSDITVNNVNYYVTGASNWTNATSPLAQAGLYAVTFPSGVTTLTPITNAQSAFKSSPYGTLNAYESFTLTQAATLTAGNTYAVALLTKWTGTPTSPGQLAYPAIQGGALNGFAPQITFTVGTTGSQTDLTAVITSPAGTNTPYYQRLA